MNAFKWFFNKFRWAYFLLVCIIGIQSYYLYNQDIRFALLMGLSLLPGIGYITIVRYSDVGQKEPRGAVALAILIGILLIYPAIWLENFGISIINELGFINTGDFTDFNTLSHLFLISFSVIALVEEGLKFLAFFLINLLTQENDEPTDSIVYTVGVSGGFAIFENYRYIINASQYSFDHGFYTSIIRSLTAIPLHLGVGLLMGYYLSKYFYPNELEHNRNNRFLFLFLGLFVPIILHGIYDFLIFYTYMIVNFLDIIVGLLFAIILTLYSWNKVDMLRSKAVE